MNALLIPDKGSVTVDEYSSANKKQLFEIRKRVGVVFQNPDNQIVASIVEDDVAFGPENLGVPRKEIGERIDYALNAVGMQEYRHSSPMHLSGGQKQRIAIAGVLALKPEILVLDESTAMLDPKGRKEVLDTVKELNAVHGVTVITITHYMDEILDYDDYLDKRVEVIVADRIQKYHKLLYMKGTVTRVSSGNIGVTMDEEVNDASQYGVFWFKRHELRILEDEDMKGYNYVAIVNLLEDYNKKDYAFALFDEDEKLIRRVGKEVTRCTGG